MGHPDGAHTHGGGGFDPMPILITIAAVAIAGPVMAAVAEIIHILLITVAVLAAIAGVGLVAFIAYRLRHRATESARQVYQAQPLAQRRSQALPAPRPTIEHPQEIHLHLYGVTAEDVAAIIARQTGRDGG